MQLETSMFSQFMFKPAGAAVTGRPVHTQGVQHVRSLFLLSRLRWRCSVKPSKSQASLVVRLPVLRPFVMSLRTLLEPLKSNPKLRVLAFRDFWF